MPWQVLSFALRPVAAASLVAYWPMVPRRLVLLVAVLAGLFMGLAWLAPLTFRPVFPSLSGAFGEGLAAAFLAAAGSHWTFLNFALGAR